MGDEIDELIDEILVDAYGDDEQLWSFRQAFEENARFPFVGQIVGVEVDVVEVDYEGDERRGLVAVCRRGGQRHTVSLRDVVPAGPLTVETRHLLVAYRRWSGAEPLPEAHHPPPRWVYPRFAHADLGAELPLTLRPRGDWNPADDYWGEPDEPLPPLWIEVISAGIRPQYEMEQVIPGIDDNDEDDWDDDPIVDAADLHQAGRHREAIRLLEELLARDRRCVDAWAHLGNIAFDTRGPGPARELYETGVGIAERSLPDGFAGVLPRGMIDNRPFTRCLHGLGLCAWRQRRWDDAEEIFRALVWLDPTGQMSALACLGSVQARQRWTRS